MTKRKTQWIGMAGLVAVLLVAGLAVVSVPVARTQGGTQPTMYTYVSQFQIPRALWAQYSEDTEKNFVPIAEKMTADGTLAAWSTFEHIIHTPDGYTHGAAWTSPTIAGLMKTLDEVRKGSPRPGQIAATKHEDFLMQSSMYQGGSGTPTYVRVVCQMAKADKPDDFAASLKKFLVPAFDEQIKKGAATFYALDSQYVNTGAPSLRCLVIDYPNAEGMDKWAAAIGATLGKMTASERAQFAGTTVPDSRRDILARITHSGHK